MVTWDLTEMNWKCVQVKVWTKVCVHNMEKNNLTV